MVSPVIQMPNNEKHSGVSGIPTQLLVNHSGECPLRGGYAQSLTQWANIPLAQGGPEASWHWFSDPIAIVAMVHPNNSAWHASEANGLSEGFEQAGYARFTRAEWLTAEGLKSIDNHAWIMAQRMKALKIPHRWLTTAEVEQVTKHGNRTIKGLCNHRQIDPETRTDPGDNYPFDVLNSRIAYHLVPTTVKEVMALVEEKVQEYAKDGKTKAGIKTVGFILGNLNQWITRILEGQAAIRRDIANVNETVKQLAVKQGVTIDYAAIAKAVNDDAAKRMDG